MYSIVKIELIKNYLNNYDIEYDLLSLDVQALIVVLFNILAVLFFFVCFYIMYRIIAKFIDIILD